MPLKRGLVPRDNPTAISFEELPVTNAAAVPFASIPDNFDFAWIEVESATVRIRVDRVAPTTTVGHFLVPGQSDVFGMVEVRDMLAIAVAGNATLRATYYRELVA